MDVSQQYHDDPKQDFRYRLWKVIAEGEKNHLTKNEMADILFDAEVTLSSEEFEGTA